MPLTYGNGSAACDGHTFIMTLPAFLQGYALRNKLVGGGEWLMLKGLMGNFVADPLYHASGEGVRGRLRICTPGQPPGLGFRCSLTLTE